MLRIGPAANCGRSEASAITFIRGKQRGGAAVAALVVTGARGGDAGGAQRDRETPHTALLTNRRTTCSMRDHRFEIRCGHKRRHNWKR